MDTFYHLHNLYNPSHYIRETILHVLAPNIGYVFRGEVLCSGLSDWVIGPISGIWKLLYIEDCKEAQRR